MWPTTNSHRDWRRSRSRTSALQAIAAKGGITWRAPCSIAIIRQQSDGGCETISLDLRDYSRDPSVDVELQPEDLIIVPE